MESSVNSDWLLGEGNEYGMSWPLDSAGHSNLLETQNLNPVSIHSGTVAANSQGKINAMDLFNQKEKLVSEFQLSSVNSTCTRALRKLEQKGETPV